LSIEIQLQRGDNEEEMARNYQIKLMALEEEKKKEEAERMAQTAKRMKYSQE
jgi:hypothetical protein